MTRTILASSVAGWLLITALAGGQEPSATAPPSAGPFAAQKDPSPQKKDDKDKDKKDKKEAQPPLVDFSAAFAQQAESPTGLNVHMIGDLRSGFRLVNVLVPSLAFIPDSNRPIPIQASRQVRALIATGGNFKIAENEYVLPENRFFFTYNYYNNVSGPAQGSDETRVVAQNISVNGVTFPALVAIPGVSPPRLDVHQETIGFERTFLDGAASFGMRVPFIEAVGSEEFNQHELGDITLIAKYAPWLDSETGSGVALGLAATLPTGQSVPTVVGSIHPAILQPFVAYQLNRDRLLVFGFSSLAAPTDSRDVTLLLNDLGVGYRLFEGDGWIRTVVPALEAHVTTPLDHRQATDVIQGFDLVDLTAGVHVGIGGLSSITFGITAPVTRPHPFDVEAIVQLNIRF
jgi:hypothetical protein